MINSRREANLEYSQRWIRRAQLDFKLFKHLVPFKSRSYSMVHCQDPALAIYLLQQSIEKAIKAVAVATGEYSHSKLRLQHGHNSLSLLLNFFNKTLVKIEENQVLRDLFQSITGLNATLGKTKIQTLGTQVRKREKSRKEEELFAEQYAKTSYEGMQSILNMILLIRKGFVSGLSDLFNKHGQVDIPAEKLNLIGSIEDLTSSVMEALKDKMNIPELSSEQKTSMVALFKAYGSNGIVPDQEKKYRIKRRYHEEQTLGQWSLIALLFLAAYTFPHESTTRYPKPLRSSIFPSGAEDYTYELGIVKNLGLMGYIAMLALNDLNKELPAISTFFSELNKKKTNVT